MNRERVLLIVLDGFGCRADMEGNAVEAADAPTLERLCAESSWTLLEASGEAVGLPEGQMGNSEVGHMNLGAGRVVYQMLTRINVAIRKGDFFANEALGNAIRHAVEHGTRLHLLGLVSDGGVHSSQEHLHALLEFAKREGLPGHRVFVHVLTDGRDTGPRTGAAFLRRLEEHMHALGDGGKAFGAVATVGGRFHGMDRDKRWDRTRRMFDAMVRRSGARFPDAVAGVEAAYEEGVTDEFVEPFVLEAVAVEGRVQDGDSVVFFNFRPDRARQLTRAFTEEAFEGFDAAERPHVRFTTMTRYDETFGLPHAFGEENLRNTLGEIVARAGLKQLRVAETEKYAHVTYFLNGGEEKVYPGEERVLVQSPKHVKTYDEAPEMSAAGITEAVVQAIEEGEHSLVVTNFANCDMVGHTGDFAAAVTAVETVDRCLSRILEKAREKGWHVFITADHGNAEEMVTAQGTPQTAHTTFPVPLVYDGPGGARLQRNGGILADVAPTILRVLGLELPGDMTGRNLLAP